jgi:hypothetical protein
MNLLTTTYSQQVQKLPEAGQHIIAQYDEETIVVYQAYRNQIGNFAAQNGYFDEGFSLNRMSWIKPNFLWMMYRGGWGKKEGQEVILAITLQRQVFDNILELVVHSKFIPEIYPDEKSWKKSVDRSNVRLQWDPDRNPNGNRLGRRAIQLGLRGEVLAKYAREWIVSIQDVSEFAAEQYEIVKSGNWDSLIVPTESVYKVNNSEVSQKLQLSIAD